LSAPYATCQELTSGSSSVLPVSLTVVLPDDEDAGVDEVAAGAEEELELLQAASKASGTTAAAVHTKRNLLPTRQISFALRTFLVRCLFHPARGCVRSGPRSRAALLVPG
jgi:hypothetical protein